VHDAWQLAIDLTRRATFEEVAKREIVRRHANRCRDHPQLVFNQEPVGLHGSGHERS
jgi:hypothetical protein